MKYSYDAKTDILLIKLSNEKPDFGEQKANIITHYNKKGKPVEIEILNAKKTTKKIVDTVFEGKKSITQ
jgi:uncharacterized protein YuzE